MEITIQLIPDETEFINLQQNVHPNKFDSSFQSTSSIIQFPLQLKPRMFAYILISNLNVLCWTIVTHS